MHHTPSGKIVLAFSCLILVGVASESESESGITLDTCGIVAGRWFDLDNVYFMDTSFGYVHEIRLPGNSENPCGNVHLDDGSIEGPPCNYSSVFPGVVTPQGNSDEHRVDIHFVTLTSAILTARVISWDGVAYGDTCVAWDAVSIFLDPVAVEPVMWKTVKSLFR